MRAWEILRETFGFGYKQDNPALRSESGREWLLDRREMAQEAPRRDRLIAGAATAWMGTSEQMWLPTALLRRIPGMRDENRRPGEQHFDWLLKKVEAEGWRQDAPVIIHVNHLGQAWMFEGNTRVAVAEHLGIPYVLAEVKWWNGAEEEPGEWRPEAFAAVAKSNPEPLMEAVGRSVLYHWTTFPNLVSILETNTLKASAHEFNERAGVSFTRSPEATLIRGNVILVLDEVKLRQRYRLEPRYGDSGKAAEKVRHWDPEDYVGIDPRREAEEFIARDVTPIDRYLVAVIAMDGIVQSWSTQSRSSPFWKTGQFVLDWLERHGVELIRSTAVYLEKERFK
jgi:hypothetical protein